MLLFVQGVLLASSGIQQPLLSSTGTFTHTMHINSCEHTHTHTTLIKIINESPLNTLRIKIPTHELGGGVWLTQAFGAQNVASYFIRKELNRIPHFPSLATTSLSHLQPSFAFCYHGGRRVPAKGHLAPVLVCAMWISSLLTAQGHPYCPLHSPLVPSKLSLSCFIQRSEQTHSHYYPSAKRTKPPFSPPVPFPCFFLE